jgi:hypothetical protein|tara:strand:- start:11709 stop:11945 length:237 start_codon:yes stop_codon:yes gene_type:complete
MSVIVVSEVYELINTGNEDINKLTVDFSFMSRIKKKDAIEQIDKLVSLADDNNEIQLIDHKPTFWEKSRWSDVEGEEQ